MARKFSGAARAKGFRPIQVSDANIRRMREENQRVLEGMRARQESIRENDQRVLQAMKEDAAYYQSVRDRDFRIADQNLKTELQQSQYTAEAEQYNLEQSTKAMDTFVSAISSFSKTAQKAQEAALKKRTEQVEQEIENDIAENGPFNPASIKLKQLTDVEEIGIEQLVGNAPILRELGVPEYFVQQKLSEGVTGSVRYVELNSKALTVLEWPTFRTQHIAENNPEALLSPDTAQAAANEAWAAFKKEKGLDRFSKELLGEAIQAKATLDKTFIQGVTDKATDTYKAETIEAASNAVTVNPTAIELSTSYRRVFAATNSHAQAQEWLQKQATAMDDKGNFIFSDGQWMSTSLREDGKPYYTGDASNPGTNESRGLAILNAREEKRREWDRNQNTTERQKYQEESKAWHRHIVVEGNNTPADLAAAAESFRDDVRGMPEWLRKLRGAGDASRGGYNSGLITTAKDFQARKMLDQKLVDKVFEVDPKLGNELQESLNDQDPFMRNDRYKGLHEIVSKMHTQKDQFGKYPQDSVSSYNDSEKLQESYEQLVRNGVADGASIDDAATAAGNIIQRGFTDESSPFYRSYNPNTGFYEFANLQQKTAKEIADSLDQADTEFAKKLASGQVQDVFSDPNMILTDIAFDKNIADMARPGYAFPARVEMLAEKLKASPMEIMQKIADVKGKPEIKPPPSLQTVTEYPPAAKTLIQRFRSANRDVRGHGVGISTVGTGWNEGLVPATMREYYRTSAARHGVSPAENSAIGEIESAHGLGYPDPKTKRSYIGGQLAAFGPMQILPTAHPEFFAQHGGNPSDEAVIDYGTQYYAMLKERYNGDAIAAAMSYNGGSGNYDLYVARRLDEIHPAVLKQMVEYGHKFAKAYYKYSGDASLLQHPILLRN